MHSAFPIKNNFLFKHFWQQLDFNLSNENVQREEE